MRAAATQFAQRGFEATSFGSIASVLGKPRSAIGYHQFASKLEIARAIVAEQWDEWMSMKIACEEHPRGVERVFAFVLTATTRTRADDSAAAAARLISESRHASMELPAPPFCWYEYAASEFRYAVEHDQVSETVDPLDLSQWLLNASHGVITAERQGLPAAASHESVRRLWVHVMNSLGFRDAHNRLGGIHAHIEAFTPRASGAADRTDARDQ